MCPSAKDFFIDVTPDLFHGSETGTTVKVTFLKPDEGFGFVGIYGVVEFPLAPTPEGLILHTTHEGECGGFGPFDFVLISPGETKTCTFTNEYRVTPQSPTP